MRAALARAGFTRVMNWNELTDLLKSDPKLSPLLTKEGIDPQKLSNAIGPILQIQFYSYFSRGNRYGKLSIAELSTGTPLLEILFDKPDGPSLESDALYPLFNEVNKWAKECGPGKGGDTL